MCDRRWFVISLKMQLSGGRMSALLCSRWWRFERFRAAPFSCWGISCLPRLVFLWSLGPFTSDSCSAFSIVSWSWFKGDVFDFSLSQAFGTRFTQKCKQLLLCGGMFALLALANNQWCHKGAKCKYGDTAMTSNLTGSHKSCDLSCFVTAHENQ